MATVQFNHRLLAACILVLGAYLWIRAEALETVRAARFSVRCLAVLVVVQIVLGVSTLLLVVPVPLAAAHQAGAMLVLTAALVVVNRLRNC